jgi:hypothetical protein
LKNFEYFCHFWEKGQFGSMEISVDSSEALRLLLLIEYDRQSYHINII